MKERVCRALNAERKQQMACEFDKKTSTMHTMLFPDRALEAKNAQVMGHNQNFEGGTERKKSEPNEPRDDKSEQK